MAAHDINLNGNDGVRMTWPRFWAVAAFLVGAGITLSRVDSGMKENRDDIAEVKALVVSTSARQDAKIEELTRAIGEFANDPPPEIDRKRRIKK